jgi:glucuronoarabinoxylan endo-1,4-beta-xylanase
MGRAVRATAVFTALATFSMAQVTLQLDPNQEIQTIEGFGAHGSANIWWGDAPFYTENFARIVIEDIGLTMIRNEFYPDYEPSNDNGDPNAFGTFNMNGSFGAKQRDYITSMSNYAAARGEPLRFIVSYWTPPSWMKQNNSGVGGNPATNVLRTGVEHELAEYGAATVKAYKDYCGVDLYGLSMQNEPAFDQTYNSCVYTPSRYRDVFKVFATRVHAEYPDVKLFGAEHMLENWGTFEGQLSVDTLAQRHVGAFAVHGYSDGAHPTSASQAAGLWRRAAQNTGSVNKQLWMTETSGYFETWTDCIELAESIYAALKHGKVTAWVWWQLGGGNDVNEYTLMTRDAPTMRAYILKHFARYVRPGAIGIGCTSSDSLLFAVAFRHPQHQTLSIVLINPSSSARTITLTASNLPTLTVYRSSASERCVNAGTLSGTTVTMPPSSVVTLYGTGYNPATSVQRPIARTGASRQATNREYLLDGRMAGSKNAPHPAVRCIVEHNRTGVARTVVHR